MNARVSTLDTSSGISLNTSDCGGGPQGRLRQLYRMHAIRYILYVSVGSTPYYSCEYEHISYQHVPVVLVLILVRAGGKQPEAKKASKWVSKLQHVNIIVVARRARAGLDNVFEVDASYE